MRWRGHTSPGAHLVPSIQSSPFLLTPRAATPGGCKQLVTERMAGSQVYGLAGLKVPPAPSPTYIRPTWGFWEIGPIFLPLQLPFPLTWMTEVSQLYVGALQVHCQAPLLTNSSSPTFFKTDISPDKTDRCPINMGKDAQHHWFLEKCKLKLQSPQTSQNGHHDKIYKQ